MLLPLLIHLLLDLELSAHNVVCLLMEYVCTCVFLLASFFGEVLRGVRLDICWCWLEGIHIVGLYGLARLNPVLNVGHDTRALL